MAYLLMGLLVVVCVVVVGANTALEAAKQIQDVE